MSMNTYTVAYALGYYYGRSFPENSLANVKEEDRAWVSNEGFKKGLEAGRRDFQEVDLVKEAVS